MKKIVLVSVGLALLLLAGCLREDETANVPTAGKITPPESVSAETAVFQTAQQITVETGNFFFKPDTLAVKVNQPVEITFKNSGNHNFSVPDLGVSVNISGATATANFTPAKVGTFEFFCNVGKHRQMGQKGTIVVTE